MKAESQLERKRRLLRFAEALRDLRTPSKLQLPHFRQVVELMNQLGVTRTEFWELDADPQRYQVADRQERTGYGWTCWHGKLRQLRDRGEAVLHQYLGRRGRGG